MKQYLFIMRQLPHISSRVQETLDQMLTTAAFDQSVSVLFVDDGVMQLKTRQNPQAPAFKNTAAIFKALEIYDITDLFVEIESLSERGLLMTDLILPVQLIPRAEVNQLIQKHAVVIPD